MTHEQSQAIWELCRQGYPMSADEAERRWSHGQRYEPDDLMQVPRSLRALIEQCNYEAASLPTHGRLH
jgi:hypothetical protein